MTPIRRKRGIQESKSLLVKTTLSELTKDQLADLVIDLVRKKANSLELDGQALHAHLVEAWEPLRPSRAHPLLSATRFRLRWLKRKLEHNEGLIDHMLKEEGFGDVEG